MNSRAIALALSVIVAVGLFAAPFAGDAQQAQVPRIGALLVNPAEHNQVSFREALRELGLVEGRDVLVEYRSAAGRVDRLTEPAAELVRLKVDIIVAHTTPAVEAARRATTQIPIVMACAGDPVSTGLIASLAHPGGNITGVACIGAELAGKNLELIKEVRPTATRVAVLTYPTATDAFARVFLQRIQSAAQRVSLHVIHMPVHDAKEVDAAFATMARERAELLMVQPNLAVKRVADLALKYRLPSIAGWQSFAEVGALMSYGGSNDEYFRLAAVYVDKILKGSKPADLPVEQPRKPKLVINLKTATALGLTVPRPLLLRADELIQ